LSIILYYIIFISIHLLIREYKNKKKVVKIKIKKVPNEMQNKKKIMKNEVFAVKYWFLYVIGVYE